MTHLYDIRKRLDLTQKELAVQLGVSQGSISFYENGQTMPPAVAAKLIEFAAQRGVVITFDDLYAPFVAPEAQQAAA